jgi:hypothetical protein
MHKGGAMAQSEEDQAFGWRDDHLKSPRGRDDLEGDYLVGLIRKAFKAYPKLYRARWVARLREQPEEYWKKPLCTCTSVEELELWFQLVPVALFDVNLTNARDVDVRALARLDGISRVENLRLEGPTLSTKSVQYLLSWKCDLSALRSFRLQGDPERLGDACARLFAQAKKFGELKSLDLLSNGIGEAGALAFAQAKYYGFLMDLRLIREDMYTEVGLRAIAQSSTLSPDVRYGHQQWLRRLKV